MTPCTCHPGNVCAIAASCAAARRVEFGANMTTPQPAALPELPEPDAYLFQHEETGNTMFVERQQVEWGFEANNPRLQKISGAYTADQMRAYALAALQSQPAAAGVSDQVVKALLAQALFFKEGAHTVASLEADIRAILALRPQAEPVGEDLGKAFYELSCQPWSIPPDWSALNQRERDDLRNAASRFAAMLRPQAVPMTPEPKAAPKLIGWRTSDYLMETADKSKADNWSVHHEMLPIFEGDPHTKLGSHGITAQGAQGEQR